MFLHLDEDRIMKFGKVDDPGRLDLSLPKDHPGTAAVLRRSGRAVDDALRVYVGCSRWGKADLKGFYPPGIKNELDYYSSQFNCVELNATFYRLFPIATFEKWYASAREGFRFFPKFDQTISHFRRLRDVEALVDNSVTHFSHLREKLGMPFLQMHNNFAPKDLDLVEAFVENWRYDIPLAIEFRHTDWFNDPAVSSELYDLLEKNGITNVLVDTAGRRDLMHMRMTTPSAMIRFVGANHPSDYTRLDAWIERIASWKKQGLENLYFFVHQNIEKESPLLSAYFIKGLNKRIGSDLHIPHTLANSAERQLFPDS